MQRHRQFDHAEAGAEMAAGHRHGIDGLGAQFLRKLRQIGDIEPPQIGGRVDAVEQGRFCGLRHEKLLQTASHKRSKVT